MKAAKLMVSDKVVLHEHWLPCETRLKPRPKRGRVYCVREVYPLKKSGQYISLVGLTGRKGKSGQEMMVTAAAFRRIHSTASITGQEKGGA
jgi:hypothetical protein